MRKRKRKKRLGIFSHAVLLLNYTFVLSLLASYLASAISPSSFWPVAFMGLAYPFILLSNIFFIVYWLVRRPLFAIPSLLTIALGWKFLFSTFGFRESSAIAVPKSSAQMLRVMTWNVHNFRSFNPSKDERATRDQMLDVIRKEQPDILCLQEYYSKRRGENNIRKSITDILRAEDYYIYEDFANPWEQQGLAIFAKLDIHERGGIRFPKSSRGNEAMFADFIINGKTVRIYNVHLQSISFKPEDYAYINSVREINTDIGSSKRIIGRLKAAFIKRSEQVNFLKKHISGFRGPYIIAGDFNDTPVSYAVNELSRGLKNSFRERGSGFGITYNGDFPNFQIDYILSTPDFEIKSYLTIHKKLSDHYPVISDLVLN